MEQILLADPADAARQDARQSEGCAVVAHLSRSADFISGLFDSIIESGDDLAHLLLVNGAPQDGGLATVLDFHLQRLAAVCPVTLVPSEREDGAIGAFNEALQLALTQRRDVVLLSADALLTKGALSEMAAVAALDPMVGFVGPRSNDAAAANSTQPERLRMLSADEAERAHRTIQPLLPRVTYAPAGAGFCLYIKHRMLVEFGLLDPGHAEWHQAVTDLVMRCNRRGYRTVLANRAYVRRRAGPIEQRGAEIPEALLARYPEYDRAVRRFYAGPEFLAQTLLTGLVPERGRVRLLFDCTHLDLYHSGTFELAKQVIGAFVARHAQRFDCFITCNRAALEFHGLDRIDGLSYVGDRKRARELGPYYAAIRLAQPLSWPDMLEVASQAPIVCFLFLDTICLDCQYLDEADLGAMWRQMLKFASMVGFISEFSREQFWRRFPKPAHMTEFVALLSTDAASYAPAKKAPAPVAADPYVLIVGNQYVHKAVREAVDLFLARPNPPALVVLGVEVERHKAVTCYRAGNLDADFVTALYAGCSAVVYPSHYEGFGLPLMHALGHGKPVVARALAVFEEIRSRTPLGRNIHLFETTEEIVDFASTRPRWIVEPQGVAQVQTWSNAVDALHDALVRARQTLSYEILLDRVAQAEDCRRMIANLGPAGIIDPMARTPTALIARYVAVRLQVWMEWLLRFGVMRWLGRKLWARRSSVRKLFG